MRTRAAVLAAAGLLALAAPVVVHAQADHRGDADPRRAEGGYDERDQDRADLGRELGLRADQRSAFQAYEAATMPSQAEMQRQEGDMQRFRGMTTPQRLDFTAQQMQRDQADFGRRADAVRRFYAQLTPQQQRHFDHLTGPEAGADGDGATMGGAPR